MTRPLQGADAQILDFLVQVCRIGRRRGTWTVADVRRVAMQHLHPRYVDPAATPTAPRRQPRQRKRPAPPTPNGPPAHVDLTPRLAQILAEIRAGRTDEEVAVLLHLARPTVSNQMTAIARRLGAVDRHHALRLVEAGAVEIHVKDTRRKAS